MTTYLRTPLALIALHMDSFDIIRTVSNKKEEKLPLYSLGVWLGNQVSNATEADWFTALNNQKSFCPDESNFQGYSTI